MPLFSKLDGQSTFMSSSRKLAAIMFTDIVGYTALMGVDEEVGMRLLHSNRALQKPIIELHGGHWLKEMGDGVLASFDSAFEAVSCAMAIQRAATGDLKNKIRIGIHLGDVRREGNDVFGDGVNIASRLESVAAPGGIMVSEAIRSAIRSNKEFEFKYLGEIALKNVAEKVRSYSIVGDGLVVPSYDYRAKKRKRNSLRAVALILFFFFVVMGGIWLKNTPLFGHDEVIESIAVLPFADLTGDPRQQTMLAGLHDNLITTLSKVISLRVISRTSVLQYRNPDRSSREIAQELGVDALLESSVYKFGDSIRMNVQLIDASRQEQHLWAESFDWPLNNILNLFNQLSQDIATEINLTLTPTEQANLSSSRTVVPEAYREYLLGEYHAQTLTPEGLENALYHFEKSLRIDSSYAPVYGGMAFVWIAKWQFHLASHVEAVPQIYRLNQKALELDQEYANSQYIKALMSAQTEWDWDKSENAFKKAIRINPSHAMAHAHYGHLLIMQKRFEEALRMGEKAVRLDPKNEAIQGLNAVILWHAGQLEEALRVSDPLTDKGLFNLISESRHFLLDEYDKSFEYTQKRFGQDSSFVELVRPVFEQDGYHSAMQKWSDIMKRRFGQGAGDRFSIAVYLNRAGAHDEAISWLERGFEEHDVNMPYAFVFEEFANLRANPSFTDIARKMKLPL
jgi:adenylate cyclase